MTAAATLSTTLRRCRASKSASASALGGHGREPFVVHLDRHPHHASQLSASVSAAVQRGRAPVERQRQPDDDHLGLLLTDKPGDLGVVVTARGRPVHARSGPTRSCPRGRHGDPDALRPEVDAHRPHTGTRAGPAPDGGDVTSARRPRRRRGGDSSAASIPVTSLPPAVAMSPLPPPPPPPPGRRHDQLGRRRGRTRGARQRPGRRRPWRPPTRTTDRRPVAGAWRSRGLRRSPGMRSSTV